MKIEKINDHQIRCTLSKEDLEDRNINIGELVYGTGKTKELFQDMMSQAHDDFGFEVNDIPLMVEAIPISPENIVLLITKVEDKKEAESHLSKFFGKKEKATSITPDDLADIESLIEADGSIEKAYSSEDNPLDMLSSDEPLAGIYVFNDLREVIYVSKLLKPFFKGTSSLYKSSGNNKYYLTVFLDDPKDDSMDIKLNSILVEYGTLYPTNMIKYSYICEHYDSILNDNAIDCLCDL